MTTPNRADVTFEVVEGQWRTTSYLNDRLNARGFQWGPNSTRAILQALYGVRRIERQDAGGGYRWRRPDAPETPAAVTADDLVEVAKHITEIASQLAAAVPPPPPPPNPVAAVTIVVGNDCDLATLTSAQQDFATRIARRAAYETGRAMLTVLDGWIEGATEEAAARGDMTRDPEVFGAADVRRMVNDACRLMGAPEAYRA